MSFPSVRYLQCFPGPNIGGARKVGTCGCADRVYHCSLFMFSSFS
jgi:hypothetical protein